MSSRDSQPDEMETVLVISSDEIKKARAEAESVSSETGTADCHPVILNDSEEDTDRFVDDDDASTSGMVKNPLKVNRLKTGPQPPPTMIDEEEEIEIFASGFITEEEEEEPAHEVIVEAVAAAQVEVEEERVAKAEPPPGKSEPRATITEIREVEPLPGPFPDEDTTTDQRPKPIVKKKPERFDDETMPMPKPDLVDIGGAMETVPLNSALVQNVLAQVDARAAARAAGQPVPHFQVPAGPPLQQVPPPHATPRQPAPPTQPVVPPLAPRRLGIEILITVLAFLFVAVPALYYLYVSFTQ